MAETGRVYQNRHSSLFSVFQQYKARLSLFFLVLLIALAACSEQSVLSM